MKHLLACLLFTVAAAQQTENVFIVSIDGIRNNEAFEAGNRYLPCVWDSLRPQGTVYSNFMNCGITVTNAGHSTILTGCYQLLINDMYTPVRVRPREPGIAEYYRQATGAPASEAVYISGKPYIVRCPVSTWPGYGSAVGPAVVRGSDYDAVTWDSCLAVIARWHPRLCYLLLGQVDFNGHSGDTATYTAAIRFADSLVWELWKIVQADSQYRDRTTLIITSDHGRHDDRHGGWTQHGCECHGCRHIPFLAVGPEIKRDTVIECLREQIDIAPTVGRLLGFPTPFSRGRCLTEMLVPAERPAAVGPEQSAGSPVGSFEEVNLSNSPGPSGGCAIALNGAGLHVIYVDSCAGGPAAMYTRSTDRGNTWSAPVVLSKAATGTGSLEAVVTAVNDSGVFAVFTGLRYSAVDSTFLWQTMGRRSTDGGRAWDQPVPVETLPGDAVVSTRPAVAVAGDIVHVISLHHTRLLDSRSADGGATFGDTSIVGCERCTHHPHAPAAVMVDTLCYAVWQDLLDDSCPFHNVWFDREPWSSRDLNLTWSYYDFSYEPDIAADDSQSLHVAYAHLAYPHYGNDWKIGYTRSDDHGVTWTFPTYIQPRPCAYSPRLASFDRQVYCVWATLVDSLWHISGCRSTDRGRSWSAAFDITSSQSYLAAPAVVAHTDTLFVVWQDRRSGNWDIFFTKHVIPMTGVNGSIPADPQASVSVPSPCRVPVTLLVGGSPAGAPLLCIQDAAGRAIRTLCASGVKNGTRCVTWDGRDDAGRKVRPGVYFVRVESASEHAKVILTR